MQYLLLLHIDETGFDHLTADQQAAGVAAYGAFTEELASSGRLTSLGRLRPRGEAKSVRISGGRPLVTDGPFTETKEQIGGFYLIEAETMDEALALAARCPAADHGVVEVRQLW